MTPSPVLCLPRSPHTFSSSGDHLISGHPASCTQAPSRPASETCFCCQFRPRPVVDHVAILSSVTPLLTLACLQRQSAAPTHPPVLQPSVGNKQTYNVAITPFVDSSRDECSLRGGAADTASLGLRLREQHHSTGSSFRAVHIIVGARRADGGASCAGGARHDGMTVLARDLPLYMHP